MPNVTVNVVGGTDTENLTAISVGGKRWGEDGASWGDSQSIPAGENISIGSYYTGDRSSSGTFTLEDHNVSIDITADGLGETGIRIEYE